MTSPHQPPGLKAVVVGPGYPLGLRLKFNADTGTGEGVTLPVSGRRGLAVIRNFAGAIFKPLLSFVLPRIQLRQEPRGIFDLFLGYPPFVWVAALHEQHTTMKGLPNAAKAGARPGKPTARERNAF